MGIVAVCPLSDRKGFLRTRYRAISAAVFAPFFHGWEVPDPTGYNVAIGLSPGFGLRVAIRRSDQRLAFFGSCGCFFSFERAQKFRCGGASGCCFASCFADLFEELLRVSRVRRRGAKGGIQAGCQSRS
jgi:hypothetical protein